MADVRKSVECDYCGAEFHIKYTEDISPTFCCFCSETFDNPDEITDEEDDDGDLDYIDEERDETEEY
jgi:hypothetical protein